MQEWDPTRVHNEEGSGGQIAFTVTSDRVGHYGDVVEHMVNIEVARCKAEGFTPTKKQIDFLRKEVIRYAVIRRDVLTAQTIKIPKSNNLHEADDRLSPRP